MDDRSLPVIGIPRALLYYRCGTLWNTFFETLGVPTVKSPPTTREILERGSSLAVDETCLSAKLFMGHVDALIGQCDRIFIPRYSNYNRNELFCTRFEGLYDQTRNVFWDSRDRFISCNVDGMRGAPEEDAYEALGKELGFSARESRSAYRKARDADEAEQRRLYKLQERSAKQPGIKILLTGHGYILSDPYLGAPIIHYLKKEGAIPIRTDETDRSAAKKASAAFSPTCRWVTSEELVGGTLLWKDRVDGVILMSAFPCGPDSMTNELLTRRMKGIPVLNLVLDAQSGTAGVETRLESFLDIIRFNKGEEV